MQRLLTPELKQSIALQAISGNNVTQLAQKHQVCRNTVYRQKLLAQTAIDEVFLAPVLNNKVLFDLPVTKDFLRQVVLGMLLICKASYRDVQLFLRDVFDTSVSIGTIFNIRDDACHKAAGNCLLIPLQKTRQPQICLITGQNPPSP